MEKERIIINFQMYLCKPGTSAKISELLKLGDKASRSAHESGIAYEEYDKLLWNIIDNKKGYRVENVYHTT